ncbi:2-octaprenyl-3-methyl-6-methoxy-1,4-benzoquinol hydroxylase [Pseudoalteromonas sp. A25]|uniref:FAD-dependent oxidoreductase n=1 Tax=Pseudoalteromonas sp. A25 TaxID=116092 RepID=UPI0012611C27|nr:FAD-dependent oxidoreductase [Pseudoalteromonas sp. A25]BBN82399.1 2-octaprenyl-3-methyl-6-methoxy-1,4-benzoquinol hydroxylase [Pseudoalteromonas sp. A25]
MKNKVVVVGGGMVGAAMALKLAKQGAQVTVLERHLIDAQEVLANAQIDIRVSAINRFSESLLDELGAMPLLRDSRIAPYHQLEAYEQPNNTLLFDREEVSQTHLGHLIENKLIQASLWAQFTEHSIEVEQVKSAPVALEQNIDSITLHYEDKAYQADLIIAADGGRSQIRQLAGIGVTGWQYQQACMGILIKLDAPQQYKTWQQFKPSGPIAFLPMQAPYANLIWYQDGAKLASLQSFSNEQLKEQILEHFFELPGDFTVEQKALFPLARQHANQYSQGRLVLVGDAAHTINPLAGQGVNLGFKDVAALAECLEPLEDMGSTQALKAYERKRRGDNLAMMSMMDACYFGFSNEVAPLKLLRNGVLKIADQAGPLKRKVLEHAMGW